MLTISIMTVIPSFRISFSFAFGITFLSLCFLFSGFEMDIGISIGIRVMVSISQTMVIDGWSNSMSISNWSCIGYWSMYGMVSIRISVGIGMCVYSLRCGDSRSRSKDSRISFSITLG